MNLRIITKNHAADQEIGFLPKSISKPNGCATAMPTAWELKIKFCILSLLKISLPVKFASSYFLYFKMLIFTKFLARSLTDDSRGAV